MKKLLLTIMAVTFCNIASADVLGSFSADEHTLGLSLNYGIAANGRDALVRVSERVQFCSNARTSTVCRFNRNALTSRELSYNSYNQTISYKGVVCATVENVYNGYPNGIAFNYAETKSTGNCVLKATKSRRGYEVSIQLKK